MPKVFSVCCYRSAPDPAGLAAYAELAGLAVQAAGGRILVRGGVAATYEAGLRQRTVIVEFDSVEQARACYEGDAYRRARALLGAVERDFRIVEGIG